MIKQIYDIKTKCRKCYDSLYCLNLPNKIKMGNECSWFVDTSELNENSIVYSGGVGNDISFELELVAKFGCRIKLFDPSQTGLNTMIKIENQNHNIQFFQYGLDEIDNVSYFSNPMDKDEGSFTKVRNNDSKGTVSLNCRSLTSLTNEYKDDIIHLLKIDIEGFEYGVLNDILKNNLQVNQICVEFHHFFKDIPRKKTKLVIDQLKNKGYKIIHKHRSDYTFKLS